MALKKDTSSSRQLAAIMFTDIVGYTKLMGENEEKALQLLSRNKAIQKPLVQRYHGRWLKEIGDGTLSSFSSALDAVYCANKIMKAYKANPEIQLRIGIHLGDVTFSGGDVYGDGVNIASRLEEHAQSDEILISDVVYHNIKNVEGIKVEYIDEVELKNVNEPLKIYRVSEEIIEHSASALTILQEEEEHKRSIAGKSIPYIVGLVMLLLISYFLVLNKTSISNFFSGGPVNRTLAVMQFENPRGPEDEVYSIGLTEDILMQLTRIHELTVIQQPRSVSTNPEEKTYQEIGETLGVAHLLEGSVWKEGNQIRVTARLIDTRTSEEVWSDIWVKPFKDIFAIQSELAVSIAEALKAKITSAEVDQIKKLPTTNITAYDLYWKGREYYSRFTMKDNLDAKELFTEALELDSNFTLAHAGLSDVYSQLAQRSHVKDYWLDSAYYHAMIVAKNEPDLSGGHKSLGLYYSITGNTEKAIDEFKIAVDIDNNLEAVINLSRIYYRTGRMDESLRILDNARYLHPLNENILFNYGATYYRLTDFQRAHDFLDQALKINPGHIESLLLMWFIATLTGDPDAAYATSSRIGYYANDNTDEVLTILQSDISDNISNFVNAAESLTRLLDNREYDYVDIPYIYMLIAQVYFEGNLMKKAKEMLDFKVLYNIERIQQGEMAYKFYYEIAQAYAIAGEKEEAYKYLEMAGDRGWPEYLYGLLDPSFKSISNEPRFQDLIEKARERVKSLQSSQRSPENLRIG